MILKYCYWQPEVFNKWRPFWRSIIWPSGLDPPLDRQMTMYLWVVDNAPSEVRKHIVPPDHLHSEISFSRTYSIPNLISYIYCIEMLHLLCVYMVALHKKLTSLVALVRRLAGSGWGAGANNAAGSHPCPGPFNRRVLRSCVVSQCSYPPLWHCHQRRPANCDWMPASHTSGQTSHSCRYPTCWASSQRSYIFS